MSKTRHSSPHSSRRRQEKQSAGSVGFSVGKKIAFSLITVVFCLAAAEALLAVFGIAPESHRSDPSAGFASQQPLFVEEVGPDGLVTMVTAKSRLDFFNLQRFPKDKASGVYRIFSMGESTTYGHPYDDATSFNGWLREFLRVTAPERRWEVINAGGISYGSQRVVRLMEELVHHRPDLFVIYCGHNEFLERRIERKLPKVSPVMRGLTDLARQSRTATLLKRAVTPLTPFTQAEATLAPSYAERGEPQTLLDNALGPTAYTRDEAWREQTFRDYESNLVRMIDIARAAGARVIFVTPASNLREASPFKSEHRKDLSEADRRRWQQFYEQARQDFTNSSPTNALAALSEAAAIDDLAANVHFLRGRVLEKLGRFAEAKAAYERARDEDICPLRAPEAIRKTLMRVTSERQVPLIDFQTFLEARSDHGIPGAAWFLDHVHPTIEGYRLLALEILKTMEKERIVQPSWDSATILRTTQDVLGRIDSRKHGFALMNLCKTLGWAGKREEAYRAGAQAVKLSPNVAQVQYEAGLAAQLSSRIDEAIEHYRRALDLKPDLAEAHCSLGVVLEDRGQLQEAIAEYRLAQQYGKTKNAERDQRNLANAIQKLRPQ